MTTAAIRLTGALTNIVMMGMGELLFTIRPCARDALKIVMDGDGLEFPSAASPFGPSGSCR